MDRFSWFSFDGLQDEPGEDGIYDVDDDWDHYGEDLTTESAIKDLEAMLILALRPAGNMKLAKFGEAQAWNQVANVVPDAVQTLEDFAERLV